MGETMTREEYIERFTCNFIAIWVSKNYDECCSNGDYDRLKNPPIEDAVYLAKKTYDRFEETLKKE